MPTPPRSKAGNHHTKAHPPLHSDVAAPARASSWRGRSGEPGRGAEAESGAGALCTSQVRSLADWFIGQSSLPGLQVPAEGPAWGVRLVKCGMNERAQESRAGRSGILNSPNMEKRM